MLYTKPQNIRYVDMAIWIDNNAYEANCNDEKLFEYLYHLSNMLAHKHKFFRTSDYYDDFCIFASTYFFNRIKSQKQYELNNEGSPKQKKITSILNYIKKSIFGLKTNYEKSSFYSLKENPETVEDFLDLDKEYYTLQFRQAIDYNQCEFALCLKDLPRCLWEACKRIPYATDSKMLINIYLSVLLTVINQITLPKDILSSLLQNNLPIIKNEFFVDKLYISKDPLDDIILYDLPASMKPYILLLVNRGKKTLARDLSCIIQSWEPDDVVVTNLIQNQVETCLGKSIYED